MSANWEPGHRDPRPPQFDEDGPGPRRNGSDGSDAPDASRVAWLIIGALAIAGGTALGWDSAALASFVSPPPLIRAALVGLAIGTAVVLLLGALNRLAGAPDDDGRTPSDMTPRAIGSMIRGVRLVFLAVAALAAGSGWLIGHPLPLVVALVIAGVDVLETSFLLIVVGLRGAAR